jgi:MacB-like periplasmic core domain
LPAEEKTPGGAPVTVISYRLWQTHFGANPAANIPTTIVGVAPAVFQGSITGMRMEMWIPMMMEAQLSSEGDLLHDHHNLCLFAYGRLKPGVTRLQAQAEMTSLL